MPFVISRYEVKVSSVTGSSLPRADDKLSFAVSGACWAFREHRTYPQMVGRDFRK